jgi:hypothetical protein
MAQVISSMAAAFTFRKKLAKAIFKNEHANIHELNKIIQDIGKRNYEFKLQRQQSDTAKNYLNAQINNNQGAFIYQDNVYPEHLRSLVYQKGVAAFTLEEPFYEEMTAVMEQFDVVPKEEREKIIQYINKSVDTAQAFSDLLALFPINYHHVIKTNYREKPFIGGVIGLSDAEINDFKKRNKSGLDAIKQVMVRNLLLS